jgi:glyceraldehyde 3-phosphate dehydrogenase
MSLDIFQQAYTSVVELRHDPEDLVKIMSWYDNEWGCTNQMLRETLQLSGRMSG